MSAYEPLLEQSIEISAAPDEVWDLVHDIRRMADWSPQVESSRLRTGWDHVELGTQFTNLNREGELEWVTHSEVVRFEPGREIAFRIEENRVIWSFRIDSTPDGGTLLVQRRETPDGISDGSLDLTEKHMGGQKVFTRSMLAGMRTTLENIRAAAG